jgi:cytochrome c oxidase assembly factor CtaG
VLLAAALLPAVLAVVTTLRLGSRGYRSIVVDYPGLPTALASTLGRTVVVLASTLCVGGLATALLLRPRRGPHRLTLEPHGAMSLARWSGLLWGVVAAGLVLVDAGDVNGQPLSRVLARGGLVLVEAAYLPRAWIVVVVGVSVLVATAVVSRGWPANAVGLGLASVAVLAPLLVEHVLVGPNHDFAGDATILGAPAAAVGFGVTVVLFLLWRPGQPPPVLLHRYGRLVSACWVLVVASDVVVALVETEGTSFVTTSTGQLFGVRFAVLAALGGLGLTWWRRGPRRGLPVPPAARGLLAAATVLIAVYLGAEVAMTRIPSPQYFVPTSIAQNFLGYDVTAPPTLAALALHWRANLLFGTFALVGTAAYLLGVRRLARRGDRWPVGRTLAWIAGWLLVVVTTSSGVGRYAGASFSIHMALHMSLNMFAPVLLVLGGPVTLLLRATPGQPATRPPGPHEWVTALTGWRLTRSFTHPLHALASYTTSYYVLYFTDLFDQANRYHWAHELMNLEFLAIGYLFFSLIIGVDPPPRPLPHLARLGLVLAAMPFHAFFGVIVMTAKGIIAGTFYGYLHSDVSWMTDLPHDQYVGGGIAWATGEIPLTFVMIALLVQWARQDSRHAARLDRHLDAGLDDSYDAYNRMLAQLAAVDAGPLTGSREPAAVSEPRSGPGSRARPQPRPDPPAPVEGD